jgi:RNA polymerase subunit RPABC4/transcription elongation factor Spt4
MPSASACQILELSTGCATLSLKGDGVGRGTGASNRPPVTRRAVRLDRVGRALDSSGEIVFVPGQPKLASSSHGRLDPGDYSKSMFTDALWLPSTKGSYDNEHLFVCPGCGQQILCGPQSADVICKCGLILPAPAAERTVSSQLTWRNARGKGIIDGRLTDAGGWVIYNGQGIYPELYSILKSGPSDTVTVGTNGRTFHVNKNRLIQNGPNNNHERLLSALIDGGWDPFSTAYPDSENLSDELKRLREIYSAIYLYNPENPFVTGLFRATQLRHALPCYYYSFQTVNRQSERFPIFAKTKDPDVLAGKLARELAEGEMEKASATLMLWHQLLWSMGLVDPELPEKPSVCAKCGRLTNLEGICPPCFLEQMDAEPLNCQLPRAPYLQDLYSRIDPSLTDSHHLLVVAANRVNLAVAANDVDAYRWAVRCWNFLFGYTDLRLPLEPMRCSTPSCGRILAADASCPACGEPDEGLRLARLWLHQTEAEYLKVEDLQKIELIGDEVELKEIHYRMKRCVVTLNRERNGAWQDIGMGISYTVPVTALGRLNLIETQKNVFSELSSYLAHELAGD